MRDLAQLDTKPLDAETWPDFARLAEDHHGVWDGCWCLNFHEEGAPRVHTHLDKLIRADPPPPKPKPR